jgi:hypothetical protein
MMLDLYKRHVMHTAATGVGKEREERRRTGEMERGI